MRLRVSTEFLFLLVLALCVTTLGWASGTPPAQNAPASGNYVGSETCKSCHEEIYNGFTKTAHYKLITGKFKPAETGCEACHGPGEEHVAGGGDKTKIRRYEEMKPRAVAEACLSCHNRQPERANFLRSEHGVNDVACTSCHDPHFAKVTEKLLRQSQPKLCYECHGEVRTEFSMPFHHRVPEGVMKCTDCHSQHGGVNPRLLRAAVASDQICFRCHSDKRGPYVFEHAPAKVEGCQICHTPHGSTNARMLRRNEVRFLCLECHSNTPTIAIPGTPSFHNQATARFQNCTTCHVQIHGSNSSSVFFE